jgi:hypothetical protein
MPVREDDRVEILEVDTELRDVVLEDSRIVPRIEEDAPTAVFDERRKAPIHLQRLGSCTERVVEDRDPLRRLRRQCCKRTGNDECKEGHSRDSAITVASAPLPGKPSGSAAFGVDTEVTSRKLLLATALKPRALPCYMCQTLSMEPPLREMELLATT